MKVAFQSKPLHLTACILLFWKGISLIVYILLMESGILHFGEGLCFSTCFTSAFGLVVVAAFSESRAVCVAVLVVLCLAFLVYWALFVLLAINRSGAGVASVGLLILCGLDLPITVSVSFAEEWWSILLCLIFHASIFLTVVLLRRSRPGVPTPLSKMPDSI